MRRFGPAICTLIVAFAVTVSAESAAAQDGADHDKSDQELAEETFNEGAKAYLAGDYSEAVLKFLTAFEHKENAMILYNLSLAYTGLQNWERAIEAAERAGAREDLPDKVRPRNSARVVALERIVSSTEIADEIAATVADTSGAVASGANDSTQRSDNSGGFSAIGWTGVGASLVGLGALGYAAALEVALSDEISEFEADPTAERRDELEADQTLAKVVLFSGAGLLATGVTLLIVEFTTGDDSTVAISPTRGGATVDATFRF